MAMDAKAAILLFARQQTMWLTPENQQRFEHVIALVEEDQMAPEDLARIVQNMMEKQGFRSPDVTLRSVGQKGMPSQTSSETTWWHDLGPTSWSDFGSGKGKGKAAPSYADVMSGKGNWVPFGSDYYYDDSAGQWKGKSAKGGGKKSGYYGGGKPQGKGKGKGGKGKRKGPVARNFDEAAANLSRFLTDNPTFIFQPRNTPESLAELYKQSGEVHLNLLKNIRRHMMRDPEKLHTVVTDMATQSHWRVDRNNNIEKNRQQRNQDGRSTVSGFTFRSGSTTRF